MDQSEFRKLLDKYQRGTATDAERKAVEAFFKSYEQETGWPEEIMGDADKVEDQVLASIYRNYPHRRKTVPFYQRTVFKVAATFLLIIGAVVGIYNYQFNTSTPVADLAPGYDKATLQLADGTIVPLDSTVTNIPQQATAIIQNHNGQLQYQLTSTTTEVVYNMITTPRGGQYQITLADGSNVWLNAASSLRYPVAFTGNTREVELTGEAYFEIAKNEAQPFKVRHRDQEVQVLGTHFNVMAYEDEGAIKTTLLEGSVLISLSGGEASNTPAVRQDATSNAPSPLERAGVRLTPGQQAQLVNGKLNVVNNADLEEALAWKNGKFAFEAASLDAIMRQLSRWYNVEFEFDGNAKDLTFFIDVSRKSNVSAVLRPMELTETVHFEIYANKIVVKPGKKTE